MRAKGIILLALAAVAALSCSVREDDMPVMGGTVSFKATLADAPFTKTVLQSDGSVYWSPGDAVNLFYGATGSTRLESDNTEPAAQVNFTGTLEGFVPDGSSYFWAVYPYDEANSFDGSAVTLTLPAVQTAVAGTFADDLFVTMAHSKDYTLQFYNVCGGVKFSVAGEGIKYVTFKGNSDEVLAGKVKVGLDEEGKPQVKEVVDGKKEIRVDASGGGTFETGKWYYVVAFPDTLASGYTMSFYDDKLLAERVENSSVILKRSVWGKLTEADDVNITATRWLTFASEGTTTISLSCFSSNVPMLYYSYDKTEWTQWDYSALTFTSTDTLYLCGDNPGGFSNGSGINQFVDDGSNYGVSGDIMSLLDYDNDIKEIPSIKCFSSLFYGCKLTEAPSLPATTLTEGCYSYMFRNCANLKVAPDLPATKLPESCYASMFTGCSGLQTAPEVIPASTLEKSCCEFMFQNCTSLKVAPNLPATTLAIMCYRNMFDGCTSLTTAPEELPATTLAASCYLSMFKGCNSLTTVPEELPATTLATSCYRSMFYDCRKLQTAPVLPAEILVESCYQSMFGSCTILNYVKCLAKNIDAELCTTNWLNGVNSSGTFVKASGMDKWTLDSESGIPAGWTVYEDITVSKYLTFTSEGTTTISLSNTGGNAPKLYYSYDKTNWTQWNYSALTFTSTDTLYLCGDNPGGFSSSSKFSKFVDDGSIYSVSGDIMSLLDYDKEVLKIPSSYCFNNMFSECKLTDAPALPATTLTSSCYLRMFSICKNLEAAPELPATTLADGCYADMFYGCENLQTAPEELPATTLAINCYYSMFQGCKKLNTAPVLPAETLVNGCYRFMFRGCSNLNYVKCLATNIDATNCTENWLNSVSSSGSFVKASGMTGWSSGESGIPAGWTVENAE